MNRVRIMELRWQPLFSLYMLHGVRQIFITPAWFDFALNNVYQRKKNEKSYINIKSSRNFVQKEICFQN